MKEGHILFLIVVSGLGFIIILYAYEFSIEEKESDALHELNCQELKKFILSKGDPSQEALNHWTVCTAGGWR